MNVIRLRFRDHHEDIEVKTFDELTIAEWEEISKPSQTGEDKADILYRMFGIPHEHGRRIVDREAMTLLKVHEDWIQEHSRAMELMASIRDACEQSEDKRLDAVTAVWKRMRPSIEKVQAFGQTFTVPQNIGTEVNYGQWMNLQVAIDQRAVPPDPDVEGDKGREGTTSTQFYAAILACMLTNEAHPEEWHDDGTKEDEIRFRELFEARTAVMRHARIGDAIEVCSWLLMQRAGLTEEVAPGLPRNPKVAAAQVQAGSSYFSAKWGNYSHVAEPAMHYDELRRMYGDRGMVTNYPAAYVLRHMGYLTERSRFDAATQTALYEASKP